MTAGIVIDALTRAGGGGLKPAQGLIHHAKRGIAAFQPRLSGADEELWRDQQDES